MSNPTDSPPYPRPTPKFVRLSSAIILAFCVVAIVNEAVSPWAKNSFRNDLTADEIKDKRVERDFSNKLIMYTFYDPVGDEGCCGMTKEGHENLVASWKEAWKNKGWEARVLTGDDAKKHDFFGTLDTKLARLGLNEYNRRCFWRWLAMVQVGGGWMSDYDTFPLELTAEHGMELSKSGTFKSFGKQVPCLIHASADEWYRILHEMIRMLPRLNNIADPNGKHNGQMISDMYSLNDLGESGIAGELWDVDYVASHYYYQGVTDGGKLAIECDAYWGKLAVHLSHSATKLAFREGKYPIPEVLGENEAVERRTEGALVLMDDYKNTCVQPTSVPQYSK